LGNDTALTAAVNSQCANLGAENTLAPGLGGTMSTLPSWIDNPTNISDAVTNMWLTVCDMRSYISDVLSLCCKSICDYLQVGFVPYWNADGTGVKISFIDAINPVTYEDGAVPPAPTSPWLADGTTFPLAVQTWLLAQFPSATQSNVQFILDDGNGNSFTINTGKKINQFAQLPFVSQYFIDFTAGTVPANYDQTSINQTINISFTYDVIINSTTKTCTFDATLGLPYECNAPKPYNCNGEIVVLSNSGTDMQVKVTALQEETPILQTGAVTSAGSGLDTLEDTVNGFPLGLPGFVVTVTDATGATQCRRIIARPTVNEIQVDSDWDPIIDNTWTYEIKDYYYSYAPAPAWQGPSQSYITTALTGFDVYVVLSNSSFDINDENTWQIMAQANNVSPIIMCQGTGYIWGDDTFQGNTEYIVIVQALYKCGASEFVSTTTYNQIAASVSIQVGTPPNLLFGVFDVASTYVLAENVLSNNNTLVDKYAQIGIPARYALDLPTGVNVTEVGITPLPAVWSPALPGGSNNISKCGMCLPYNGNQTVLGQTVSNHDFVIGLYTGYSVEIFQLDQFGTAYIPLLDNNGVEYKTASTTDPALLFLNNTPQSPNIIYTVPATYPYDKLPFVVRYDPNQFKVNQSPDYHTISFNNFVATLRRDAVLLFGLSYSQFTMNLTVTILRWDSGTNTYIQYPTPRFMTATATFVADSIGANTSSNVTFTITSATSSVPGYVNSVPATYGDAFLLEAWTSAPSDMYYNCGCYQVSDGGCSFRDSNGSVNVSVTNLATTVCSPTSCGLSGASTATLPFATRIQPFTGLIVDSGCLDDCSAFNTNRRSLVVSKTGIITEDYTVSGSLYLSIGPPGQGQVW